METESMRRKGRQEHGRVCSEIQASIRETYNHTRTHTQTLSSRAGGETARYLAVVAVVAVVAVDCLFVDEVTTPLSTKAKLCIHRYMNLYTLMCALWILCIRICVYILYIDQSLIIYIHSMGK